MMRYTAVITSSLYEVVTIATIDFLAFPDDLSFKIARHIFFSVLFSVNSYKFSPSSTWVCNSNLNIKQKFKTLQKYKTYRQTQLLIHY